MYGDTEIRHRKLSFPSHTTSLGFEDKYGYKKSTLSGLGFFFFQCLFSFERERETETETETGSRGGAERERGRQNLKQAPGFELSAQSLTQGLNPQTVRSWREPKLDASLTELPKCPLAFFFFKFIYLFWERERRGRDIVSGGGIEKGRPRIPSSQRKAQCGAQTHEPWDHDLSRNPESDAQRTATLEPLDFL